MKFNSFIAITSAAVAAAALWLWFHHPLSQKPISNLNQPAVVSKISLPTLVPANAPKMVTVSKAEIKVQSFRPTTSGWTAVQVIVDTHASYEERLKALASLSGHLTDSDWQILRPFLLKPNPQDSNGQLEQVIKNRLMDVLCAMNPPPSNLGDTFIQIYRNYQQNDVIRDYAVQHMATYYEQIAGQSGNSQTLDSLQKVLWEAVNEPVGSIGGTALLALKRLSQEYNDDIDQEKVAVTALAMANNAASDELSRITAYQVCAQLNVREAMPTIVDAAQNGETISVKMSAIGALGLLGGPEQIPLLNSVLKGNDDPLKPAAQHALDQINGRQNQLAARN